MTKNPFPSFYEEFIYKSRYSRWIEEEKRRENWDETVSRYLNFISYHLHNKHEYNIPSNLYDELYKAIYNLEVMPSMRAMMTAGPALERDNTAGYNCAYLPIDDIKSFDEAMYILLCGTGVGFSVSHQLPILAFRILSSERLDREIIALRRTPPTTTISPILQRIS